MKKKSNACDDNGWAARGGYMAAKVSKLDEQFKLAAPTEKHKEGTSSSIFNGIAIYVNGYTDPSADELRRLMMLHGGQFHVYYSRTKTTHIIANNLPNSKIQELKGEKVVRPAWITDSIKAGQLLPYLKYQLYSKGKGLLFTGISVHKDTNNVDPYYGLPQPNISQNNFLPQQKSKQLLNTYNYNFTPNYTKNHASLQLPSSSSAPQDKKLCHPQPQMNSLRCQSGGNDVEMKINGQVKTVHSLSHSSQSSTKDLSLLSEVPVTNGLSRLNNSALMQEDLFLSEQPFDLDLSERTARDLDNKCSISSKSSHSNLDPYDFPHSPENQSEKELVSQDHLGIKDVKKQEPKTLKNKDCCLSSQQNCPNVNGYHLHENVCASRLNGSFQRISGLSLDNGGMDQNNSTIEKTSPKPSSHLQAQTDNLISEFYSHSRLHQISTWRSAFSEYVNELHCKRSKVGSSSFPGSERLKKVKTQSGASQGPSVSVKSCIFHVDMDCFFVSVGIRHRPDLKGKPVAVTSNRGQGRVPLRPGTNPQLEKKYYEHKQNNVQQREEEEDLHRTPSQEIPDVHTNGVEQDATALSMAEIASCSYEARQAGVKNGMFFGKAKQLCPSLQAVPYDFDAYKQVALAMYETLASYTHDIEALSCDEVLIDATSVIKELDISPHDLASAIRADIEEKTGCCASVGMGSNILLARLATRRAKPNGQYFLESLEVDDFIRDLTVTSLPGVGPAMGRKLAAIGVRSCGDLQQVSMSVLQKKFGPRTGQTLYRFCRGLDDRPVRYEKERKSVSAEMNYNIRFTRIDEAECFLTNLSMEVQKRLKEAGLRGRKVTLKVMIRKVGAPVEPAKYGGHGICDSIARTVMLTNSTDSGLLIATAVIKLFHAMKLQVQDLRGVGIQVQLLEGNHSLSSEFHTRSIKDLLTRRSQKPKCSKIDATDSNENVTVKSHESSSALNSSVEPAPETSKGKTPATPKQSHSHLNLSIEVPSPSQVDRSVLEALPAELRVQVEQSWTFREGKLNGHISPSPQLLSDSVKCSPPVGKLILQIPNQPENTGIELELPNFSQIDPDVFAALPKELQDEIKSSYRKTANLQKDQVLVEVKNPLLQLKQAVVGPGRAKKQYKRKNNASPAKNGPSPIKRRPLANSPAKTLPPPVKMREPVDIKDVAEHQVVSRASPTLAGASKWTDIKILLREWVTTITEPMEEDILQVVKYCTDLIEDKDLEKLDLVIKYMRRLMKQSVESVWSMAFDFIVDNIQVVLQQTYGSTLKLV